MYSEAVQTRAHYRTFLDNRNQAWRWSGTTGDAHEIRCLNPAVGSRPGVAILFPSDVLARSGKTSIPKLIQAQLLPQLTSEPAATEQTRAPQFEAAQFHLQAVRRVRGPALSLADLVGSQGEIFGIDPIPEIVAAARRAADRLGLRNVQFSVGLYRPSSRYL